MSTRKTLKLSDVARMPLPTLKWFWEGDFENRTTIVIAMSQGLVKDKIEQVLLDEPFLRETLDAAHWAEAELKIARERFLLMEDPRLGKTRYNLRCIQELRVRVSRIFDRQQTRINRDAFPTPGTKAIDLAERLMIELFRKELRQLHHEMALERQMDLNSPWGHNDTESLNDYIERSIHDDMVRVPEGSPYARLRAMPWPAFVRMVQGDARSQSDRVPELRDLRLRARWERALDELLAHIAPAARGDVTAGHLASVDYAEMSMDEAQATIRARRAFLSMWQRRQEVRNLTKEHKRTMERLRAQFSEPWKMLALDARQRLILNHPKMFDFLMEELKPYTVDGEYLSADSSKPAVRGELKTRIMKAARARFPDEVKDEE